MTTIEGKFKDRQDHHHALAQLPPVGGPELASPAFLRAAGKWRPGGGGIVFMGPTGAGKTTAMVYLARVLLARLENATSMVFAIASDLAEDRELAERAKRVKYLFLDDVGRESDPKNRIFQVLDHRHTRAPTFISTGLKPVDIDQHYDGATVRRIFEFQGKRVTVSSAFSSVLPRGVGPSQEDLAKRFGEKL